MTEMTAADTNGNQLTYSESEIVSNSGVKVTFGRDGLGRITSVTDPAGKQITYGYTGDDLTSVTDRDNNKTELKYHPLRRHYVSEVIDPLGRTGIRAEYDASGRLKEMFDADGGKVEFVYEPDNYIQRVKDPYGKETVYEYTNEGNIIEEIHPNGKKIDRIFDDRNNVRSETETTLENGQSKSRTTSYTYDGLDNKLTETDPLGNTSRYSYGNYGRLTSETDPLGNTTTYNYDSKGNLLRTVDPNGRGTSFGYDPKGNLTSLTDAKGQSTTFSYDSKGNVLSTTNPDNQTTTYTYDASGNRKTETQTVTTPTGTKTLVTKWDYSNEGNLLATTDPDNKTSTTTYDPNGNPIEVKDALNRVTKSRYDDKGQLVETLYPDATPSDADNPRTVTVYDRGGRQRANIDESGRVTHYLYNTAGDLIETIYPKDGDTLAQFVTAVAPGKTPQTVDWTQVVYPDAVPAYLASHPRTKTEYSQSGEVQAEIDERGNRTEFIYDDAGRLAETIYPDATPADKIDNPRSRSEYDAAGRRIAAIDGLGNETRFTLDGTGRVVQTQFDDGTKTKTEYDALGRRVKATDADGNETKYEYDGLGRLKTVVQFLDGRPIRTSYGYDELGRMVWQEDAKGNRTNYEYDSNGRRTAVILPEGQKSISTYDAVGNLKTSRDFNGQTTQYVYDERNRLKVLDLPMDANVTYTYTPTGNRQTVADGRGTTTYAYDARERLISRIDPAGTSPALAGGKTIEYGYDDAGNVVEVKTAAGTTTSSYDAQNRLAAVTDAGKTTGYVYDLAGNVAETQLPNGVVEKRTYDGLNRLRVLENVKGTTVLSKFEYTLDDAGNRSEVKESVLDSLTGMLVVRTVRYGYDDLSRLSSETVLDAAGTVTASRAWTYDDVGNRLSQADAVVGTTTYSYDKNDKLLSESGATNATYTYDNNGNTKSVTPVGQTATSYTWDDRNRMTRVVSPTTGTTAYTYDDENIRMSSRVGNQAATQFVVDSNRDYAQVLAEYRGGSLQASYVYGLDLVSQKRGGTESFYLVDGLGSTRGLTNSAGNLTDTYTYDSFGNLVASTGSTSNSYLFAGEQLDAGTGDYYLRQRYYDSSTGRFTRRDDYEGRLGEPLSLHKYVYTHANPVNYTDPSGNSRIGEFIAGFVIADILISNIGEFFNPVIVNPLDFSIPVPNPTLKGSKSRAIITQVPDDVKEGFIDLNIHRLDDSLPAHISPIKIGNPPFDGVVTRLDSGGQKFYGYNSRFPNDTSAVQQFQNANFTYPSGLGPTGGFANHAEGHAFIQAHTANALYGHGKLFIDLPMCGYCQTGVNQMFMKSGLQSLDVFELFGPGLVIKTTFEK